MITSNYRSQI